MFGSSRYNHSSDRETARKNPPLEAGDGTVYGLQQQGVAEESKRLDSLRFVDLGSPCASLSVSPNQKHVAVGGRDVFKVFNIDASDDSDDSSTPVFTLEKNVRHKKSNLTYTTNDIQWHPSNVNWVATAATSGAVVVWDIFKTRANIQAHVLQEHGRTVSRVCWHPTEAQQLLSASLDGEVKLWDLKSNKNQSVATFKTQYDKLRDVKFSPLSPDLFAAAYDTGSIRIWETRMPGKPLTQITAHTGLVLSLDWHPYKKELLASGGQDRAVRVWNVNDAHSKAVNMVQTIASVGRVIWRPGDQRNAEIATSSSIMDFGVHLWDVGSPFVPVGSFRSHGDVATDIQWLDKQGNKILSCSKDGTLRMFNIQEAYIPAQNLRTVDLSWNPNGSIASVGDKIIRDPIEEHAPPSNFPSFWSSAVQRVRTSRTFSKALQGHVDVFQALKKQKGGQVNVPTVEDTLEVLAKRYIDEGGSISDVCVHNSAVALDVGRVDVAKSWSVFGFLFQHDLASRYVQADSVSDAGTDSTSVAETTHTQERGGNDLDITTDVKGEEKELVESEEETRRNFLSNPTSPVTGPESQSTPIKGARSVKPSTLERNTSLGIPHEGEIAASPTNTQQRDHQHSKALDPISNQRLNLPTSSNHNHNNNASFTRVESQPRVAVTSWVPKTNNVLLQQQELYDAAQHKTEAPASNTTPEEYGRGLPSEDANSLQHLMVGSYGSTSAMMDMASDDGTLGVFMVVILFVVVFYESREWTRCACFVYASF